MFARSPLVFGIAPAVLNLSRNIFSKVKQESIVPDFRDVNHVSALSERVLGNALHRTASLIVTRLMAVL